MADSFISVVRDTKGLERLADPATMDAATKEAVKAALDIMVSQAKAEAPRKTGKSRAGILGVLDRAHGTWVGRVILRGVAFPLHILAVGAKAHEIDVFRYKSKRKSRASFGEYATPGGTVRARSRGSFRALRFSAGGATLFRRDVQHPGVRANPWLDRAAARGTPDALAAMDRVFRAAIDGH